MQDDNVFKSSKYDVGRTLHTIRRKREQNIQDHAEFQHPTQHNLSPVRGANEEHGGAEIVKGGPK